MKDLELREVESVSGGIYTFTIGYIASHALDAAASGIYNFGMSMSVGDHTSSNQYFLDNRDNFNLML
jgi:hypothetical protein